MSDTIKNFFNRNWILFLVLILLAGWGIRLLGFYVSPFYHHHRMGDEPAAYRVALHYLSGNEKLRAGKQLSELSLEEQKARYLGSTYMGHEGLLPGPLQSKILACGIQLTRSAEGAFVVNLLLHCLSLLFLWHATFLLFGRNVSLLALLMAALFFWPIFYTFGMWHPHFISILAALVFWCLALYEKYRHWFAAMILGFTFTLFFQFHLIGAFLIFFFAFYFLFFVKRKIIFTPFVALGVALAISGFYLDYLREEFRTGFHNFRGLMDHGLFHVEALKLFSNVVVVGSAEISGAVFGGFDALLRFYRLTTGHFAVAVPFILLSLSLPILAYVILFRRTVWPLLKTSVRNWTKVIETNRSLFLISGWFFIPWMVYFARLKYHELRFVALDFPVLYTIFALALLQLAEKGKLWSRLIWTSFALVIAFNVWISIGYFRFGISEIKKSPHLIYSLRYYDRIARVILSDIEKENGKDFFIVFDRDKNPGWSTAYFDSLIIHIQDSSFGRFKPNPDSPRKYLLSDRKEIQGWERKQEIFGIYLYRSIGKP